MQHSNQSLKDPLSVPSSIDLVSHYNLVPHQMLGLYMVEECLWLLVLFLSHL